MRVLKSGGRLAAAVVVVVAGASLGGCVTSSGPDIGKYGFVYTDCVRQNGGTVTGFKVRPDGPRKMAFDDFQPKTPYPAGQEGAMRACYDARVAKM
ncbi:hypothetical protein [Breoghania sp.]|uniref:hypothetical protein n=1 Tax=Breoghania sp. TaxID=2065378 RepID=UPI002AAAAA00|nr:hypothetical protein [Breoghania sp.]